MIITGICSGYEWMTDVQNTAAPICSLDEPTFFIWQVKVRLTNICCLHLSTILSSLMFLKLRSHLCNVRSLNHFYWKVYVNTCKRSFWTSMFKTVIFTWSYTHFYDHMLWALHTKYRMNFDKSETLSVWTKSE